MVVEERGGACVRRIHIHYARFNVLDNGLNADTHRCVIVMLHNLKHYQNCAFASTFYQIHFACIPSSRRRTVGGTSGRFSAA